MIQDRFLGGGPGARFNHGRGMGVLCAIGGCDRAQAWMPVRGSPAHDRRGVPVRADPRAVQRSARGIRQMVVSSPPVPSLDAGPHAGPMPEALYDNDLDFTRVAAARPGIRRFGATAS